MKVSNLMTPHASSVKMDDTLSVVKNIFDTTGFHHLLVIEKGRLFGIVSDRDLLKALSPNIGSASETIRDTATLNKRVHQIMSRKPITIYADSDIYEAIALINSESVSCLPVINEEETPIGVLSWRDILKSLQTRHDAAINR